MAEIQLNVGSTAAMPKPQFDAILARLREKGYQTVGPRLRDEGAHPGAIAGRHPA